MKKSIILLALVFPTILLSQIPVTDAAANSSLGMANGQLTKVNIQLKAVNKNLVRLINLMEKNNSHTKKSREILKEELDAKKEAPNYVKKSIDVSFTMTLKKQILEVYRNSKNMVQNFKYLEKKDIQDYYDFTSKAIGETSDLFKQCSDILKTNSIMQPEERLKKINEINSRLVEILESINGYGSKLSQMEASRRARISMVKLNKN